jgi:hypothetical protein
MLGVERTHHWNSDRFATCEVGHGPVQPASSTACPRRICLAPVRTPVIEETNGWWTLYGLE